jgi:hypothetical protein
MSKSSTGNDSRTSGGGWQHGYVTTVTNQNPDTGKVGVGMDWDSKADKAADRADRRANGENVPAGG